METMYAWSPDGDRATTMSLRNRGRPSGFSTAVAPFMAVAMSRANRNDLRRLKALVESGPA